MEALLDCVVLNTMFGRGRRSWLKEFTLVGTTVCSLALQLTSATGTANKPDETTTTKIEFYL